MVSYLLWYHPSILAQTVASGRGWSRGQDGGSPSGAWLQLHSPSGHTVLLWARSSRSSAVQAGAQVTLTSETIPEALAALANALAADAAGE